MQAPPPEATLSVSLPLHLWAARPAPRDGEKVPVLIGLHGYAMNAPEMLPMLQRMAPPGFLVISLQGPHTAFVPGTEETSRRIGFHWGVSPEAEENRACHRDAVTAAVRWAVDQGGDPARISLAAFSQPCSFNYRVALQPPHGQPFRTLVAICGGIPGDWTASSPPATEASRATAVLHVSTREDPFYSLDRVGVFGEKLAAHFGIVDHHLLDGGHRIPSDAFAEVAEFLLAHGT